MDGQIVITVTAYTVMDHIEVLATEVQSEGHTRSYRLLARESAAALPESHDPTSDALAQIAVVLWNAAERVQRAAF